MNFEKKGSLSAEKLQKKREREKQLVDDMIALYCKKRHKSGGSLCRECAELSEYARARSDNCPFMEQKTFCSNCEVHCYKPEMRKKIQQVMRWSGPRMMLYHPTAAIRHLIDTKLKRR